MAQVVSSSAKSKRENARIDSGKILAAQEYVSAFNNYENAVRTYGLWAKESEEAYVALTAADKKYKRWAKK